MRSVYAGSRHLMTGEQMTDEPSRSASQQPGEQAVSDLAAMLIDATERTARAILDATQAAVETIAAAATTIATAVPTALSTPPLTGVSAEELVAVFERHQSTNGYDTEPGLPIDLTVDQLVDQYGNRIAPDWQEPGMNVEVPDVNRDTFDTITPGQPLVPGIPRLDLPPVGQST